MKSKTKIHRAIRRLETKWRTNMLRCSSGAHDSADFFFRNSYFVVTGALLFRGDECSIVFFPLSSLDVSMDG